MDRAENLLTFGLPGRGKSHYVGAIGRELILRHNKSVLFIPAFKLVEKLLNAKKELGLENALKKLDRFDVVILDDIGYVQQSREEMEVLFTFLAAAQSFTSANEPANGSLQSLLLCDYNTNSLE